MIITAGIAVLLVLLGEVEPANAALTFGVLHLARGFMIVLFGGRQFSVEQGLFEAWVGVMVALVSVTIR